MDAHWPCRYGAIRRISLWLSQDSAAPKNCDLQSFVPFPTSRRSRTSEIRRNRRFSRRRVLPPPWRTRLLEPIWYPLGCGRFGLLALFMAPQGGFPRSVPQLSFHASSLSEFSRVLPFGGTWASGGGGAREKGPARCAALRGASPGEGDPKHGHGPAEARDASRSAGRHGVGGRSLRPLVAESSLRGAASQAAPRPGRPALGALSRASVPCWSTFVSERGSR